MIWWLSPKENFRRLKLLSNFMLWLYVAGIGIMCVGLGIIGAVLNQSETIAAGVIITIIGFFLTIIPSYKIGKLRQGNPKKS